MTDQNTYNRQLIEEFRANRGKSGGPMEGRPLLLLTTTGAKSGQLRTTPMMYIPEYRNLVAYPEVTVEVGNEIFEAIAIVTEGPERQRLWTRVVELYPFFADHQAKVTRQIPVIVLKRREG